MPANPDVEELKTLKLAAMDFALIPMQQIKKELDVNSTAINQRRQTQLYKDTLEEMKQSWKEKLLATPGMNDLRKKIHYGMAIAVHKVIEILADEQVPYKDIIAAARLMAQIDGRFLGSESPKEAGEKDTDSVAVELVQAIKRAQGTIQ
jgi:hypothetical protein